MLVAWFHHLAFGVSRRLSRRYFCWSTFVVGLGRQCLSLVSVGERAYGWLRRSTRGLKEEMLLLIGLLPGETDW